MSEFIKLLTTYNLFNSLVPGIVFVIFLKHYTKYDLIQPDILTGLIFYYFLGMVINRIGSLIIEPILKNIFTFKDYSDYIKASKKDQKIELLSEINNTYRTIIALFFCIFFSKLYEVIMVYIVVSHSIEISLIVFAILMLFIFSYKKQISFIGARIDAALKKKK